MSKIAFHFDDYDLDRFLIAAATFGDERHGFVVTSNADHLIRRHEEPAFREACAAATYILLDSRFISHAMRFLRGIRLRVCTGSDLTRRLLADVVQADDPLILIGSSTEQADSLRREFGLNRLLHYNPPMGFIRDEVAVERTLRFIESHGPYRFCFLAVGTPQGELLASRLHGRDTARGLTLCVGAAINFMTGVERRAPVWMQKMGLEWLFRLAQDPRRLAQRYLVRGPRVFNLLRKARFEVRPFNSGAPRPGLRPVRRLRSTRP